MINVAIIDGHKIVADGLAKMLSSFQDVTVSYIACSPQEIDVKKVIDSSDILLLDIEMPEKDGLYFIREFFKVAHNFNIVTRSEFSLNVLRVNRL